MKMKPTPIIFALSALLIAQFSCASPPVIPATLTSSANPAPNQSVGSIEKINGVVQAGPEKALANVDPTRAMNDNDAVHVFDSGKAMLVFGNDFKFTLYNDTTFKGTKIDKNGTSLDVKMQLVEGGFNGYNPPGNRTEVSLPNRVNILILGTHFAITYDPVKEEVWVRNFDGTVQYSVAGNSFLSLAPGSLLEINTGGPLQLTGTHIYDDILFSPNDFDKYATKFNSPILGLEALRKDFAPAIAGAKPTTTPLPPPSTLPPPTAVPQPVGGGSGRIAFVSDATGNLDIFKMNIANGNLVALTNGPRDDNSPTWSPNGNQIAFDSNPDGNVIFVMNADGSDPKSLTDYSEDSYPVWSPDGQKIAFVSQRDGNAEVYVMNADGTGQTRLTDNAAWDADPTWSPDSKDIAFVSNRDGGDGFQVYVIHANGEGETRFPNNRPIGTWNSFPNWSHDGAHIVFQSRDNPSSLFQIYVMSTHVEDNPVQLTSAGENGGAKWSPDDRLIAFTTNRDGNYEIYIMNADGRDQTRLTNNPADDISPAWQPGGGN